MIAEVYPLKRMSRGLSAFDYLIPEVLQIQRGMFVTIPYRRSTVNGIVKRVKDKPVRGITLKSIDSIYAGVHLREEELSFFESLAQDLFQSPATVLFSAFPQLPKKEDALNVSPSFSWLPLTLPRSEAETIVRLVTQLKERSKAFVQTPDIRRCTALILGYIQGTEKQKVLLLAPTLRDVEQIRSHLSGLEPFVITGEETSIERFKRWKAFHGASSGLMLGTRTAGLMMDSTITTIFLVRSGDVNHKQEDRNPRIDLRELAWNVHEQFSANLFCLDVVARPQTFSRFSPAEILGWPMTSKAQVIDINKDPQGRHRSITYQAEQLIQERIAQGRVLIVHQQKGIAKLILCHACGHRPLCPTCETSLTAFSHTLSCAMCHHKEPMILRCPECQSTELIRVGPGNQEVAQEVKKLFPDSSVSIVDRDHPSDDGARIVIVTSFFLEQVYDPFRPGSFSLVLLTNADTPLYGDHPSALESLTHELWQWRWLAHTAHATFLVQTGSPSLILKALEDTETLLKEDLASREFYHLPPFYQWLRITLKEDEPHKAQLEMTQLKQRLSEIPDVRFGALTTLPHEGVALEFGVPTQEKKRLHALFTSLPDRYIIDTGLFS